ncbi:MAG: hypothetical protein GEU88_19185 [Solirubrobacterales bacterium]|nr:hypothetical protein [Solirubrobacterales bacterium]
MSAPARIASFAALLVAIFAAAAVAGARLDPTVDDNGGAHEEGDLQMNGHGATTTRPQQPTTGADPRGAGAAVPGLAVAEGGYRLVPERTALEPGPSARYGFRIVDEGGETVDAFDVEHERRMHLIVVRRDFAGFQHLHPRQLDDGSWAVEADLSAAGVYRVFADFATADRSLTLATDLFVAGRFDPQPLPAVAETADAGDGYRVSLESGPARSGAATPVEFAVRRGGRELDSIEPYLGADGHLVALREHDQAFLHTHPEGEAGGPSPISFQVAYPTPGRYRLFLQFRHRGEVRTAAFTQEVRGSRASGATEPGAQEHSDGGH